MNYRRPELQERLAGEYVLGTLQGRARKRFVRLMEQDSGLRDVVDAWEQTLMPMASALSVTAPQARVWEGIAQRLAPRTHRVGLRERLLSFATWRPYAVGLLLGIGVMVAGTMLSRKAPEVVATEHVPPTYAGFLSDGDGNVTALVSSLRYGKLVDVKLLHPVAVAPDRVLRLWALPGGGAPILLGTIPGEGKVTLTLPATSEELFSKVTELAVSSEPASKSGPTEPTQPFVLRGPCARFW